MRVARQEELPLPGELRRERMNEDRITESSSTMTLQIIWPYFLHIEWHHQARRNWSWRATRTWNGASLGPEASDWPD